MLHQEKSGNPVPTLSSSFFWSGKNSISITFDGSRMIQGDQIGRTLAHWVVVYFG
jgi:hypothetical protein